jgi:hypothetical protein
MGYCVHSVRYESFQLVKIFVSDLRLRIALITRCLADGSAEERQLPGLIGHRTSPH